MPMDADDPRLVYLPENAAVDASGLCSVLRDQWFCVHPERGLVFFQQDMRKRKGSLLGAAPQCNASESLANRLFLDLFPWGEIKQIPLVIVKINPSDYE